MPGRMEFDFTFGSKGRRRDAEEPMRLVVLGDFSGKPHAERAALADRTIHRLDLDNLAVVMRRLEPRVADPAGEIRFQDIDDFHPDRLYARLDVFERLRTLRATPAAVDDSQLGRLLGKPAAAPRSAAAPASGLDAIIRNAVAPHVVKDTSAATAAHLQAVDAAIAEEMRRLLHAPAFQSIEAAWRGVQWLLSSVELDEQLQLYILDVTRDELIADIVAAAGNVADTGLHRALVDRSREGLGRRRWSALVGLFQFGVSSADIGLLAALASVASNAGGPLIADGDATLPGAANGSADWSALRGSEAGKWIGLGAPRILLRLPYGRKTDPIDAFAFEECAGAPEPGALLWCWASVALAILLGRAFTARGWEMQPGDEREIGELPACTFELDGESRMQPCGETALSERDVDAYLKAGLIPIASRRDRNAVVAVRFQSIADPPAPLAW